MMFLLGLCGFAYAQNIQIKGTVKYATDGEPIIGASVVQTGTTNGTITDFNGNFSLNVTSGTELTVSYIGFKTVKVKAQPNLKITLEEDAQLIDEVVVTGYTTQRKADLTGAVSVVKVDELKKVPENNPMRALQGKVAGMMVTADGNPGGKATIRIRGVGTLNNNDPLYIIDGVPTKAGMHELNSSDIESIQVLKDASSASIYGSRAANGVIIITTKQGKEGKIRVDLNAGLTTSWYSSKMDMLNTNEYGQALWQANINSGKDPNTNSIGYTFDWGYDDKGNARLNKIILPEFIDSERTMRTSDTDWFDAVASTGIMQNYDLSVIPKFAGCTNGVQWFKDRGQWIDNSATPSPGMIIFFDWNNKGSSGPQDGLSDHVGIVERVEDGIIYTIEGNSGDSCRENHYAVGHYEILGYGVPAH